MKYVTIDILPNGFFKYKDWICDAVCESKYSNLIKFIAEEEAEHYFQNQPERSKRDDPKMGCGALNSMET
jgi:hypothetical protein